MRRFFRLACFFSTLILLLPGCIQLPDLRDVRQGAGEMLPLARIGGIPIEIVADVNFNNRETIDGYELVSSTGAWTHMVVGRMLSKTGWEANLDRINEANGGGRLHCYHPEGAEFNWTVQWSGELEFDRHSSDAAPPIVHVAVYGDDALILYAPPPGFLFWHPGSPDDCQNPEPVKAHQAVGNLWIPLDDADVQRAPDAGTSTKTAIQSGIVVLRVPFNELRSGTVKTNSISLGGTEAGYYGTYEWDLDITLTLTSQKES